MLSQIHFEPALASWTMIEVLGRRGTREICTRCNMFRDGAVVDMSDQHSKRVQGHADDSFARHGEDHLLKMSKSFLGSVSKCGKREAGECLEIVR